MQNAIIGNVVIKTATEQDLEQILKIENQVAIEPWAKTVFVEYLKLHKCIVAVLDQNIIIGYGIIMINNLINESHILNLAVDPAWQKLGVGSKLISCLINLNNNKIFLEVHTENIPAINLYKKFNFKELYTRKNYYNTSFGTKDALVLVNI